MLRSSPFRAATAARRTPAPLLPLLLCYSLASIVATAWIEPYPPLGGGNFSGPPVPLSPDPLVSYIWADSVNRSCLQVYTLSPVNVTLLDGSFGDLSSILTPSPAVLVTSPGAFMLDFNTESAAWLEFDSPDLTPSDAASIRLSISEYTQPAIIGSNPKTGTPVAYGHTFRLELNSQLYEGVRYAWFNMTASPSAPFTITRMQAMCQTRPAKYSGAFNSGVEVLTRVWYAAAYTVKLNLLENYIGAILMDRGDRISWTGDAHVAQAACYVALDANDLVLKNLLSTSTGSNGIASYSLYFILSALDYWHATGDNATVAALCGNIIDKLNASLATVTGNRTLSFFGWDDRTGSGFQDATAYEPSWQYRMLALRAWQEVGPLLTAFGHAADAAYWAAQASAYVANLEATYGSSWWAALGLGIHAAGDAVNAKVLGVNETQAVMTALFSDPVTRCSLSNFNNYWLLQAYANAGWLDEGTASVEQCWGAELALGGTTFWEISSPEWPSWMQAGDAVPNGENGFTSLCHPWSSGAAPWLTKWVGGFRTVTPGWQHFIVAPHIPTHSEPRLTVTMPTPRGGATLNISTDVNACYVEVHVPGGAYADLLLSEVLLQRIGCMGENPLHTLSVNLSSRAGSVSLRFVHDDDHAPRLLHADGVRRVSLTARVALAAGVHTLTLARVVTAVETLAAPVDVTANVYPAQFLGMDATTQGSWQGKYGSDGYALFSFNTSGVDVLNLPSYVASVTPKFRSFISDSWNGSSTDVRALQSPFSGDRAVGCYATSMGQDPTFPIDITLQPAAEGQWYRVALYFVDWDLRGRRQSVDMLAASDLSRVAPWMPVGAANGTAGFTDGVWLQYAFNASARFRFYQSRGDNAVVSAIMFDPHA